MPKKKMVRQPQKGLIQDVDNTSNWVYINSEGYFLNINDYETLGGKNLIKDYLNELPIADKIIGYTIREKIMGNQIFN